MALAGRSARRGGAGARWLVVGVVATLLILLIDAALHSSSPGPGEQLAAGAWVDRALPIIASSSAEGQELQSIWSSGLSMSPAAVSSQIDQIASGASHNYQQLVGLRPPANLAGAAGLLEASLLARSDAAAALRDAFNQVLEPTTAASSSSTTTTAITSAGATPGAPGDPVVAAVQSAGNELEVGDQAYQLFQHTMPRIGVPMPSSVWVTNSAAYQSAAAQVFLTSLQSAAVSTPVHAVKILSLSIDPAPVTTHGGVLVLPPATAITLTFVVADVGNQAEDNLTVTASLSPAAAGSPSVRDFVNVSPGQAHAIVGLGPLTPPQGTPVTLTVTITPLAGSALAPVTQTVVFSTPAPVTTTTTTVGPPPTT